MHGRGLHPVVAGVPRAHVVPFYSRRLSRRLARPAARNLGDVVGRFRPRAACAAGMAKPWRGPPPGPVRLRDLPVLLCRDVLGIQRCRCACFLWRSIAAGAAAAAPGQRHFSAACWPGCSVWLREETVPAPRRTRIGPSPARAIRQWTVAEPAQRMLALPAAAMALAPLLYSVATWRSTALHGASTWRATSEWVDEELPARRRSAMPDGLRSLVLYAPVVLLAPLALLAPVPRGAHARRLFLFVGVLSCRPAGRRAISWRARTGAPIPAAGSAFVPRGLRPGGRRLSLRGRLVKTLGLGAAALLFAWGAWNEAGSGARGAHRPTRAVREAWRQWKRPSRCDRCFAPVYHAATRRGSIGARTFFLTPGAGELQQLGDGLFDQAIDRFLLFVQSRLRLRARQGPAKCR